MNEKLKTIIYVLLFAPTYILLYTLLHEGGHAIVILAYSGTIDNFVLGLNAHVSAHGAEFSKFGSALNHAAGMLLPTIIGAIAILFYKPKVKFAAYHMCYCLGSFSLIGSMLVWVVFPLIALFTPPPQAEDATKFLSVTLFHPLLVSLGALLLAGVFMLLMYKKGILKNAVVPLRKSVKINRKNGLIIASMGLLLTAVFLIVYNAAFPSAVFSTSHVADNVLEENNWECTFDIKKTKSYSVDLVTLSQGLITAVRIIDENGELAYQNLGEDSSFTVQIRLDKGVYALSLTYLADYEAVVHFLERTGHSGIKPDESNYYKEAFNRGTNYSAFFSIKIR